METFVLVYPPFRFKPPVNLQPPLVIAHLYAVLERERVGDVEAVDLDLEYQNSAVTVDTYVRRAVERVERLNPTVICLTCKSAQFPFVILFTRRYKTVHPQTKIVLGGWVPTLTPRVALELTGCDAVIRGEGERSLPSLLRAIDDAPWDIPGVSYLYEGVMHSNLNSVPLSSEELDRLPLPRYDCLPPLQAYQPGYHDHFFTVEASRGCTNHRCIFCWNSTRNCDTSWRTRSPRRVVEEIEFLHATYRAVYVSFADDNFGAHGSTWLAQFTASMREAFPRSEVMYGCSMRIDDVNAADIERMHASGLRRVFHGLESGSPRMWTLLGKHFPSDLGHDDIVRKVEWEVAVGIDAQCSIMIGLPEETEVDIDETLTLCRKLADVGSHFCVHLLNPYDGTELVDRYPALIQDFDMYHELGEVDNFDADFRTVFRGRQDDFEEHLPDHRWVRPQTPLAQFKQKYSALVDLAKAGLPFLTPVLEVNR